MRKILSLSPILISILLILSIVIWGGYSTDRFFLNDGGYVEWEKGIKYHDPAAYELHSEGLEIMDSGDLDYAEEHFQSLVSSYPDYVGGYLALGSIQLLLNNETQAKVNFLKSIEINPNYPQSYSRLGYAEAALGDCTNAIKYYKHALELEGNYGMAHFGIAECYYYNNDFDLAATHLKKAITLVPDSQYGKAAKSLLEKVLLKKQADLD